MSARIDHGTNGETSVTPPGDIWTTEDVALYLKVSPEFVRQQAKKKRIPGAFQIGILWRFSAARVKQFGSGDAEAA